jgi:hypothetical protein
MSNKAQFLIIGVNHHFQEARKLKAAERDAQAIFSIFKNLGLIQSENCQLLKGKEVSPDRVSKELDRIQNIDNKDLLFIYWAGHAEKIDGGVWLLTNESKNKENLRQEMIPLETLVGSFARFQGFKDYVLILDSCYSGTANDVYNKLKPEHLRTETRYEVLAACEKTEAAREDSGRYGWLTGILLDELKVILNKRDKSLNLSEIIDRANTRLQKEKQQTAKYSVEGTGGGQIVLDISNRPTDRVMTGNTDFLENAIGYATKVFCNYLNQQVVSGVELIYFLGFDVWDGCLVYDGLIHGSIEQQLLEFIRHKFLDRDRLRSKYEEILATAPETSINSELGIAGQCLKEARKAFESNLEQLINFAQNDNNFTENNRQTSLQELDIRLKTPTLEGVRYIGDLNNYSSEYREFDCLLGLRSCLYIPVIEQFFDFDISTSSDEIIRKQAKKAEQELLEIKYERKPFGGVLIAANRKPNSLLLNSHINNENETNLQPDNVITSKIQNYFYNESKSNNQRGYNDFRLYLKCINSVYKGKAEKKIGLRQGLHPSLVKKSVRSVKESISKSIDEQILFPNQLRTIIDNIARRIEETRLLYNESPVNFAQYIQNEGIGVFLPDREYLDRFDIDRKRVRDITKVYILALLWRDLRIQREIYGDGNSEIENYLERSIESQLLPQELSGNPERPTLNKYITKPKPISRYRQDYFINIDDIYPESGQVSQEILNILNNLLDDLREVKKQPSELVYNHLKNIAPIKKYVNSVTRLEGIYSSSMSQTIFCDLSHAISIWLVGLWILEESSDRAKVKSEIFTVIDTYFDSLPTPYKETFRIPELQDRQDLKEDFITLFWGIIAAIHDVAIPVQRFKDSCEKFFCQFFGEEASSQLKKNLQFSIIDVLDHPRFPIYKNAITSLYSIDPSSQNTTQRDWLECVFYRAVGKNIGHSTVGSLILVYELEPYSDYCSERSMWQMVKRYLQELSDSQTRRQEYGLFIPAYLAHAVAFSDFPKLQKLWKEMQADWQPNHLQSNNHHRYFKQTAEQFKVSFEEYPLSYLLGLLETILEPTDNYNRLDERIIKLDDNESYEDIFDYHSHFYVEKIEINQEQNQSILCLSLRLWENNMQQEYKLINKRDVSHLYRDYQAILEDINNNQQSNSHKYWYLYDQKKFDKQREDWERNPRNEQFDDFWDINDNSLPMDKCLSPRAYKILDIILRFRDFGKYFNSRTWQVKIKFSNVIDRDTGSTAIYPDDFGDAEILP